MCNIWRIAEEFLAHVKCNESERSVERLGGLLDQLAVAMQGLDVEGCEHDHDKSPRGSYDEWRSRAAASFGELGYYNEVRPVVVSDAQPELLVGDALDDLADIAVGLEGALLRRCVCAADGLWYLNDSYESHWSLHLRSLQWYLAARERES